jgi:hypothetical protein
MTDPERAAPDLTGCCKRCGTRPRIEAGPVNDIYCISVDAECRCNAGFNLWPAERSAASTQRETSDNG